MPLLLNIEFIELNQKYRGSIEIGIKIVGLCRLVVKSIGIVSVGVADVVGSSSMIIIGPCGSKDRDPDLGISDIAVVSVHNPRSTQTNIIRMNKIKQKNMDEMRKNSILYQQSYERQCEFHCLVELFVRVKKIVSASICYRM